LVVNPCRTALGFPAADRTAGQRIAVGALGGGVAAAVIIVLAAVADPLLDALHVSPPPARLPVAPLLAAPGGLRLARRVPQPEPGLDGLGASLVPVLIPLVLRPAVALLAISVAADHGMPPALAGAGLVLAGTIGAAAIAPLDAGPVRTVVRWGMGIVAVAAIGVAIAMAVDGVFDV